MITALLLGDARCVLEDAAAALDMFSPDVVGALNNIGITWKGKVDHWFTLHPTSCEDWVGIEEAVRRRKINGGNIPATWSYRHDRAVDYVREDWQGGSGLFGIRCMKVDLHIDRIVLAGCPMTRAGGHFYNQYEWRQAEDYYRGWYKHREEIAPHVRSMSGWTQGLLGAPTPEFFTDENVKRRLRQCRS